MMKTTTRFLLFFLMVAVACQDSFSQALQTAVTARVLNTEGAPVEANVQVKRTGKTYGTDVDGTISITALDAKDVLIFSATGFEQLSIQINGRYNLGNIVLKRKIIENENLVVEANTGYQPIKPNEVNGAVTVIDTKTLNQQTGQNILSRLNGVASGISFSNKSNNNPQSNLNISVRGLSTINGPLNPLVVLDNFIYEGDINNINPNDVESITILKDAAATSIYGARGGNGVIVITSKKGKYNRPLNVEVSSVLTNTQKPYIFYLPQVSSADYIGVEDFLFKKGFFEDYILYDDYYHSVFTPAVHIFIDRSRGLITAADSLSKINELKNNDARKDYQKYLYRTAVLQQHGINLRGGSKQMNYFFSANYDNAVSNLDAESKKLNLKFQNTFRPIKNLQLSIGGYYTNTTALNGRPGKVLSGSKYVPYAMLKDPAGALIPVAHQWGSQYTDTIGGGKLLDWNYYPTEEYKHDRYKTTTNDFVANVGANYQLSKALQIDVKYQLEKQDALTIHNADLQSFYTRDLINTFSVLEPNGSVTYQLPYGAIYGEDRTNTASSNFRTQLNFHKTFRQHDLSAIAGWETREIKTKGGANSLYGYNPDPLTYSYVDYNAEYTTLVDGSTQFIPSAPYLTSTINRFVSAYGNISYLYRGKYGLSASARKDGSNIFGVKTNDQWKPLWSAGAGWEISKEKFYHLSWLPYLKLRTSVGISGNVDNTRTALAIARYFTDRTTNLPATDILSLANPSLRWEQSQQVNIGVDFATSKNRLRGSLDFYVKKGSDLYGQTPYDYTAWGGLQSITRNVANMKGQGIDLVLHSNNIDRSIKWQTDLILNYNTAKTTAYYTKNAENGLLLLGGGNGITPAVGKPLYSFAGYAWGGLDSVGDPLGYLNGVLSNDYDAIFADVSKNGLNSSSLAFVGRGEPLLSGGLMNTITYKALSISFNITYRFGYYFRKEALSYTALFYSGAGTKDFALRWQQPGDELHTDVPAMKYIDDPKFNQRESFYGLATVNILRADNIRLQFINLAYTLASPTKYFKSFQFFVNAANLGILWRANHQKIDPDYPSSLPQPKSIAVGIRASF